MIQRIRRFVRRLPENRGVKIKPTIVMALTPKSFFGSLATISLGVEVQDESRTFFKGYTKINLNPESRTHVFHLEGGLDVYPEDGGMPRNHFFVRDLLRQTPIKLEDEDARH